MTADDTRIIAAAKSLGIKITNAELGTAMCAAWADRVALAIVHFDKGDMLGCQAHIDEANSYAI